MIIFKVKKAIRKALRPINNILFKTKRLQEENDRLKYQLYFLKTHIDANTIKPATGILRDYQLKELNFLNEILVFLRKFDIKPFFDGGCLLGFYRHNGFVPWDDDIDLGLMRKDFQQVIEIMKKEWIFVEMDTLTDYKHPFYAFYDEMITKNPNKIVAILSSTCIHIFKGTSLKNAVNVEIFPYDYVQDTVSEEKFIEYKTEATKIINKLKRSGLKKVFNYFEKELNSECIFNNEKAKRITYGLGNYAFTEYKFKGFLNYEDIFPLKEAQFEGINIYIPNNPERALQCLYGNFMSLPSDVGISHTIEDINDYLKDKHQDIIDYRNN